MACWMAVADNAGPAVTSGGANVGAVVADPALRVLAGCFAPVCTLVGKTWALHLEKVVKVDRDENLRMIAESVAFLVTEGKRVIYDAEHFFDGYRDDPGYALQCLRAAVQANNAGQIQQLAGNEGSEVGQLAAIRGSAMAKVYQILTPDQQQKLASLQAARRARHQAPAGAQN